jgi:hypothetical protein
VQEACAADAVIVGSGIATREVGEDPVIMGQLRRLDPTRHLLAAQCSGGWGGLSVCHPYATVL